MYLTGVEMPANTYIYKYTLSHTHRHSYCHKGGVEEREMEVEVVLLGRVRATERKQKHECKEEAESAR